MKYVYPDLRAKYRKYRKDINSKCIREFKMPLEHLLQKPDPSVSEKEFIDYYKKLMPVGDQPCIINRIAWLFETTFQSYHGTIANAKPFDYSILKSGAAYSKSDYQKIAKIKSEYEDAVKYYQQLANKQRLEKDEIRTNRTVLLSLFQEKCAKICPNEKELCDIILDLCYTSNQSKQFAWDICGETIIENLLEKNNNTINY